MTQHLVCILDLDTFWRACMSPTVRDAQSRFIRLKVTLESEYYRSETP
jgi:hypothetical protein